MTKPDPQDEELAALQALARAKRARLRIGRQPVEEWPTRRQERQPVAAEPQRVDIVARALAELGQGAPEAGPPAMSLPVEHQRASAASPSDLSSELNPNDG
jgi:hypothetical protein